MRIIGAYEKYEAGKKRDRAQSAEPRRYTTRPVVRGRDK
jgi:hypothetical protein